MPPVIGVVAGIIALAGTEVGIAISTTMAMTIATVIVSTGTAMLINGAMSLLRGALGLNKSQGLTISSRNPNAPWRIVYGHTRIAGVVTFLSTTGSNNEYIHMVLTLCRGKVHQVGTMYFDGTAIPVDGGGNGQGQWSGYVHIETDVGDPDNTAQPFPGLASADPGHWTASCLQRGHAKAYVQLKWSANLFSNGIPNITFDVQGREVYDPRSATVGYSENPALCIADYLQDQTLGLQADPSEVNEGTVIAAANVCDEAVTLKGTITSAVRNAGTGHGGTGYVTGDLVAVNGGNGDGALWVAETTAGGVVQRLNVEYAGSGYSDASNVATSGGHGSGLTVDITTFSGTEPQYTSNGAFESTQTPGSLLTDLAGAMAGYITYVQGQFVLCAGAYSSPVASLGDDDLRAPLEVQTRLSRRDLCNAVHGSYLSEANDWQATDYPAIIDGAYVDEDGGTLLWKQLDLPYTISASMCQRIAKIQLERLRRQVIVTAHCKLTAGAIQPTDVISLTHARFGWTNKTFFVTDVSLATDPDQGDAPALGIDLLLAETDADVYTWSPGNEAAAAQASANIVLPVADAVSSVNGTTGDVTLAPGPNVTLTQAGQTITVAAPLMIGDSGAGGASGTVPAPGAGDAAALKFLKADGTWQTPAGTGGGGSGTVTSVGLSAPPEFTVSGSPVTSSGTLALAKATQPANEVWAGPSSGSAAAPAFRALIPIDIPALPESQITGLVTDLAAKAPTARLINTTTPLIGGGDLTADRTLAVSTMVGDTGSGGARGVVPAPAAGDATAGKYLKADGTWAVPPAGGSGGGTVTSVGLTMPTEFSVSGSPVTAAGTLAVTKATQAANQVYAGPATSGGAALIQQTSNFQTGVTSLSLAYPGANAAGNLLIACIWLRSSPTAPTVTDTAGNTWTKAVGFTGGLLTSIWYACPAAAGANTVTYSDPSGGANHIHLVIEEVTGIVPSSPLDQTGTVTSSLTVTTTGSVSQATEWVVGAMGGCCGSVPNAIVPPAAATQDAVTYDASNVERITVAHLTATSGLTGPQSMAFTSSGSNGTFLWGTIATFKAGSAGVAPTFRALVAADIPAIPESGVTGLTADLASKAPLASPALTGTPTAPTPAIGNNSTTIATTAFVQAASGLVPSWPAPAAAVTIADGTGLLAFGPYILNSGILLSVGSGAGSALIDIQ